MGGRQAQKQERVTSTCQCVWGVRGTITWDVRSTKSGQTSLVSDPDKAAMRACGSERKESQTRLEWADQVPWGEDDRGKGEWKSGQTKEADKKETGVKRFALREDTCMQR